jgi:hypothetical protein
MILAYFRAANFDRFSLRRGKREGGERERERERESSNYREY